MSQQTAASPAAPSPEASQALPAIGAPFAGGYYAGQIRVGDTVYGLVVAGIAGQLRAAWNTTTRSVPGAESLADGLANTQAMAAAGSELAQAALALTIDGFADWYVPARDELELVYRHFKPTTEANWDGEGANESSVPAGASYTEELPEQTAVELFRQGAAEALEAAWYWSSTQYAGFPYYAWSQNFDDGGQYYGHKSYAGRARAVRRFAI
ncbi:DUF1566 domain-containing protein [Rugamonas sp. DEMB1]|uniref:Lcl C-terminal domain-containing protein n=1 Tax=Rugamonas sp. DEMB1 TaxID=3039386 RepID=UPI0024470C0D|nr:DUF1566 domain-containing protein [Rugamonas sp. DEMB1]WGG48946.1 DUF1566 domain-containing protein [Rugamonas sp. DEMB1]